MANDEPATITDTDVGDSTDTVLLGTRIPAELNDKLTEAAARMGLTKAALARMAINHGIDWILERLAKP
jgi:predicted DNA-binding protein